MSLIEEVKKKKEFSKLPDSIILKAFEINKGDIKETRAFLRKYFGVFLTNRVLKGKGDFDEILKAHISSRKRNYGEFYSEIFEVVGNVDSIIDLGCGANGYSISYLKEILKDFDYLGIEAAGQIVENINRFFEANGYFSAKIVLGDLFDLDFVLNLIEKRKGLKVVFLFQVIDALENVEKNFSKKFILEVMGKVDFMVLSIPTESLGGRRKFAVQRKWLIDFLNENFEVLKDFNSNGERVFVIK